MKVAHRLLFIQYKFHVCQVPRLRMNKAISPLSYMPSWPALGQLHFYLSQILQLLTPAAYSVSHFLSVTVVVLVFKFEFGSRVTLLHAV